MAQQTQGKAGGLPSISIVVPNYNGGRTIEATLRSLIEQDYPDLQILVVDGGSSDDSAEIIRRYESHIAWWVSEKDTGQSSAINKGFARAQGEILNWLCSDDVLLPGALDAVGREFAEHPWADIVAGACRLIYVNDPRRNRLDEPAAWGLELIPCMNPIPQPGCFFRRTLLDRKPPLDEGLHYAMDLDLWCYFRARGAQWRFLHSVLANMYFNGENKTSTGGVKITREFEEIYRRYVREAVPLTYWHRLLRYPLERLRRRHRGLLFAWLVYFPWQCTMILLLSPFYGFKRVRWMNWAEFG